MIGNYFNIQMSFQLETSTQKYDMVKDIIDAANVQNCGETNVIDVRVSDNIYSVL